jgi:hypothetical protein
LTFLVKTSKSTVQRLTVTGQEDVTAVKGQLEPGMKIEALGRVLGPRRGI